MRIRNGKIHVLYASNRVEIHPFIWKVRVQLIITQSCKKISLPRQRIIAHGQRDRWKGRKGGGGRKERRIAASFFHRLLRRKRKRGANKRGTYPRGKWVTMQIVGRNLCARRTQRRTPLSRARARTHSHAGRSRKYAMEQWFVRPRAAIQRFPSERRNRGIKFQFFRRQFFLPFFLIRRFKVYCSPYQNQFLDTVCVITTGVFASVVKKNFDKRIGDHPPRLPNAVSEMEDLHFVRNYARSSDAVPWIDAAVLWYWELYVISRQRINHCCAGTVWKMERNITLRDFVVQFVILRWEKWSNTKINADLF